MKPEVSVSVSLKIWYRAWFVSSKTSTAIALFVFISTWQLLTPFTPSDTSRLGITKAALHKKGTGHTQPVYTLLVPSVMVLLVVWARAITRVTQDNLPSTAEPSRCEIRDGIAGPQPQSNDIIPGKPGREVHEIDYSWS